MAEAPRLLGRYPSRSFSQEIDGAIVELGSQSINMKSTGNTVILTAPSTQDFVLTELLFECTAADTITVGAKARVFGTSGEICESQRLYGFTEADTCFKFLIWGTNYTLVADDVLSIEIVEAATGTSQTATFRALGYAR